ncbi:MAG: hypothetical protein WBW84_06370 [Acidobacteriaceae bacterium]
MAIDVLRGNRAAVNKDWIQPPLLSVLEVSPFSSATAPSFIMFLYA